VSRATCTGNPYGNMNCNGLFSPQAVARMQGGLREALRKLDNQVDWTQYDSDGDGYVDLVAFIHPPLDGACGGATNNHLWSHRFFLTGIPYVTHSVNAQSVPIKVSDYILESGVGGLEGCDTTQINAGGNGWRTRRVTGSRCPTCTTTDNTSEGVGEWSLMAAAATIRRRSSRRAMDGWSLSQLGWVTVVPLPTGGTFSFGAPRRPTPHSICRLEARTRTASTSCWKTAAVQADSAMVHYHCQVWFSTGSPPPCGGGLLIYHVDSAQLAAARFDQDNRVNTGPIHGLEIVAGRRPRQPRCRPEQRMLRPRD